MRTIDRMIGPITKQFAPYGVTQLALDQWHVFFTCGEYACIIQFAGTETYQLARANSDLRWHSLNAALEYLACCDTIPISDPY